MAGTLCKSEYARLWGSSLEEIAEIAYQIGDLFGGETLSSFAQELVESVDSLFAPAGHETKINSSVPGGFEVGDIEFKLYDIWQEWKLIDGWRYGTEFCSEAKTHPMLLPKNAISADARRVIELVSDVLSAWIRSASGKIKDPTGQ